MSTEPENKIVTEESAAQAEMPVKFSAKVPKAKEKKTLKQEILSWIYTLAAALVIVVIIRTFFFEPIRVDGESMCDTLQNGEIMLVTKPEYLLGEPQRFDVVICHYPGRGNTNFVKRIVGLPGDTVAVQDGFLYVNGEKYAEEYITNRPNYTLKEYTVPEGMYFVLGDNRSNSNDSHLIGPIERSMIIGHVRQVVFPFGNWRAVE